MSRTCFVVMPIGSGDAYKVYLNRYENLIAPAIEGAKRDGAAVFEAVRGDFISSTGSITRSVLRHIYTSDVVLADLTDLNANVFYELGVRHALRKGTVLIALKGTRIPFDVGGLRVVFYEDRVGGEKEAIPKIQALLESCIVDAPDEDSPVFLAIPDLTEDASRDIAEMRARLSSATAETTELRGKLAIAEETTLRLRESFDTFERTIKDVMQHFAPRDRDAATSALHDALRQQESSPRQQVKPVTTVQEDLQQVFVLMPFREEFDHVFHIIRQTAEQLGLRVFRADQIAAPGRITDQIVDAIHRSGIIVADLTMNNPNVLYEVGIAQSLGKRTVMLSQDVQNVPFDVASQRIITYDNSLQGAEELSMQLAKVFRMFLDEHKTG